MGKKLEEMTRKELWQLFPIQLTEHRDCWAQWYREEAQRLCALLSDQPVRAMHHIGSTAVEGIWAKPIVDILVELEPGANMEAAARAAVAGGYRIMSREEGRISLNLGYTEEGYAERVFHLHLRFAGDCDEVYFRNLLRSAPEFAQEYEELKLSLWKQYEYDRDAYTEGKTAFITRFTKLARLGHEAKESGVEIEGAQ